MTDAIQELIDDLNRIPKVITTEQNIDFKLMANEVSRILQRQMSGRISSG